MENRRLSYFVRIAEDGSLTKAAGVLRIAQPALSRQIRLLEEELGVALFNRTARGMQLTEEGEYLRASVAGPLRAMELALQNVRSFSSRIEGNFTIGMPPSISEILARPLVLRMNSEFPNIKLRMVEGLTASLADWLGRGILDFALLEEASRDDRLTDRELFSQPLMLVGGPDSGLAPDQIMAFEKAVRLPLILPTHHLGIRGVFTDAVAKLRTAADIRFEADSCRLMKELAESGIGYAILPFAYFRHEYAAGRLRYCPIVKPKLLLPTVLSHRINNRSTMNRVEGMVLETITGMMNDLYKA
jgi:LysR family transcriptional regulator, nitrogen assimilation regulatory protein